MNFDGKHLVGPFSFSFTMKKRAAFDVNPLDICG
jgi:hypothetical protein